MLKLLIDENLDQRILHGLQLRVPDLLYTLVQETALAGAQDAALLRSQAIRAKISLTRAAWEPETI